MDASFLPFCRSPVPRSGRGLSPPGPPPLRRGTGSRSAFRLTSARESNSAEAAHAHERSTAVPMRFKPVAEFDMIVAAIDSELACTQPRRGRAPYRAAANPSRSGLCSFPFAAHATARGDRLRHPVKRKCVEVRESASPRCPPHIPTPPWTSYNGYARRPWAAIYLSYGIVPRSSSVIRADEANLKAGLPYMDRMSGDVGMGPA